MKFRGPKALSDIHKNQCMIIDAPRASESVVTTEISDETFRDQVYEHHVGALVRLDFSS